MMESLISLSILALFVGIVLPFSMELLTVREQVKKEVEVNRFLYESALFYNKEELNNKHFLSGEIRAYSIETRDSIHIYDGEDKVADVDYISADW